ncbi:MAG: hypothetical protein LBU65_11180 [Planctomycetaceae bacterium]|jgi:hypothetical protein|nr:hypothetical protein [Planctomycetaceae bacterium]
MIKSLAVRETSGSFFDRQISMSFLYSPVVLIILVTNDTGRYVYGKAKNQQ